MTDSASAGSDDKRLAIVRQITALIVTAADLNRAIWYEDNTYVRVNLTSLQTQRDDLLTSIWEWNPKMLARD